MTFRVSKRRTARFLLSGVITLSVLVVFGVSTLDFDHNLGRDNVFGNYLRLFPNSQVIVAFHACIFCFLVFHSRFAFVPLFLLINPFSVMNFFEAYNKFALMTFVAVLASSATFPRTLRISSVLLAISLHPIGLIHIVLLRDLLRQHLTWRRLSVFAFLILFVPLVLISTFGVLDIIDLALASKDLTLADLLIMQENTLGITRDGNLAIRDPSPISLVFWKDVLFAAFFPVFYFGFNLSAIGVLGIVYVFFAWALYSRATIPILSVVIGLLVLVAVNPNMGAVLRNLLPLMIGFAMPHMIESTERAKH